MRRTERKWKSLSKQEREAFLAHAHENHEKNDYTKEHMRDARKEIARKKQEAAAEERKKKVNDAMVALEKKDAAKEQKKALRDARYTARYVAPEKAKLMGQPANEAASLTGVNLLVQAPGPSPYKL